MTDDRIPVSADTLADNPDLAPYLTVNEGSSPEKPDNSDRGPTIGNSRPKRAKTVKAAGKQTESQLQADVISLLRTLGYQYVYHTHNSRFSEPGMPDVLAIRLEIGLRRFVVIELKRGNGKLRPAKYTKKGRWMPGQVDWLQAFSTVGAESYVVRTGDNMEELAEVLR